MSIWHHYDAQRVVATPGIVSPAGLPMPVRVFAFETYFVPIALPAERRVHQAQ